MNTAAEPAYEYETLVKDFQSFMYSIPDVWKDCESTVVESVKMKKPYRYAKNPVQESSTKQQKQNNRSDSNINDNNDNNNGNTNRKKRKRRRSKNKPSGNDNSSNDQIFAGGNWDRNKNFSRLFWIVDIIRDIRELDHRNYDRLFYEYIDRLLSHVKALDPRFLAEVNGPLVQHLKEALELRFYELQSNYGTDLVRLLSEIEYELWHTCYGFYYSTGRNAAVQQHPHVDVLQKNELWHNQSQRNDFDDISDTNGGRSSLFSDDLGIEDRLSGLSIGAVADGVLNKEKIETLEEIQKARDIHSKQDGNSKKHTLSDRSTSSAKDGMTPDKDRDAPNNLIAEADKKKNSPGKDINNSGETSNVSESDKPPRVRGQNKKKKRRNRKGKTRSKKPKSSPQDLSIEKSGPSS